MSLQPVVIELRGVGKSYRLGEHVGGRRSARQFLSRQENDHKFWALRDIDLEVSRGDVLGVVGVNGSGKSTLLKVINRVTAPTEGTSRTRGQVGSLLEVGAGFHGELTGRENVFLVGSILGMSFAAIEDHYREIVEFAELQEHMATPLKRYSSGMYSRLAFSVSAHLDAEILLVDEVLSVSDERFREKCVAKLRSFAKGGRTVVFISHDLSLVGDLCTRAIWLHQGRIRLEGAVNPVLGEYRTQVGKGS